ncbi:MAG: NAD-dependent epimerase/dehydratase family protein [Woeseia sp.]
MKVLAIGATGFIGSHVVRLLTEQGHDVAVLHRGRTSADLPAEVQHIHGSRDALADVQPEVERLRPDVVLDIIPYTERQAREVVELFRGLARRIVALSSADVYRNYDGFRGKATAPPDPIPLSEDAPLRESRYPYRGDGLPFDWADDYDKILVERMVLSEPELPGTVIRLPAVYGPGDKQHRIRPYLRRMNAGRPAVLLAKEQSEWRWTRGYVENVAAAIAIAAVNDRAAARVYNVGEDPAPKEREWVREIGMAVGWTGEVVQVSAEHLPEHLRQPFDFRYELATDTARIREELSYSEPVGREEALKRTVEWELSQPGEQNVSQS